MNKRKLMSSLFAGAMTLGMTLSVSPVFAVEPNDNVLVGTENSPVSEAYLVKQLNIAEGIEYENTFIFDFDLTKIGTVENNNEELDKEITISIAKDDTATVVGNERYIRKEVNIFGENALNYTSAGIYTYDVTETTKSNLVGEYGLTCSKAKYELIVWVRNKADKSGVYIEKVQVTKNLDDSGKKPSSGDVKVNPDPIPGDGKNSNFRFENTYTKQAGEKDPANPDHYLSTTIGKTVDGEYGDLTKKFEFTVNIKLPATFTDEGATFDSIVFDNGGTNKTEETYKLKAGNNTVYLAHGEDLRIYDLPAGTKYTVTETQDNNYIPKIDIVENGTAITEKDNALTTEEILIGEKTNSVNYENTFNDNSVEPTGIIINNLPFVLMVAIAGSGLALYVVSKRRTHQ